MFLKNRLKGLDGGKRNFLIYLQHHIKKVLFHNTLHKTGQYPAIITIFTNYFLLWVYPLIVSPKSGNFRSSSMNWFLSSHSKQQCVQKMVSIARWVKCLCIAYRFLLLLCCKRLENSVIIKSKMGLRVNQITNKY